MTRPFQYSGAQWSSIARELPPGADHDAMRLHLEAICGVYVQGRIYSNRPLPTLDEEIGNHRRVARLSRELASAYTEEIITGPPLETEQRRERVLRELSELAAHCDHTAEYFVEAKRRGRPGPKGDVSKDLLLSNLLSLWSESGGAIQTSTSRDGSEGGPLVRFIIAAAKPVLGSAFTPGAARAFVRKQKNRRGMV